MRERCFMLINIGAVIANVSCVLCLLSSSHGTGVLLLTQQTYWYNPDRLPSLSSDPRCN